MFYQDVSPGEKWQPEAAARYNAVNRVLNEYSDLKPSGIVPNQSGMVIADFKNVSKQVIEAYTAVAVAGNASLMSSTELESRLDGFCLVNGTPAVSEDYPWGISLDEVQPGEYGRMVLVGTVPAVFTGYGKRVTPTVNGLTAGDAGSAWIISKPINSYPEKESYPGMILLGGGSAAVDNYYGPFKLLAKSETEVEVMNGALEDAAYCGICDVPGLREVPRRTLFITDGGSHPIYIYFTYDENDGYSVEIDTQKPDDVLLWNLLGYFYKGAVKQAYKKAGAMIFGDQWYLNVGEMT